MISFLLLLVSAAIIVIHSKAKEKVKRSNSSLNLSQKKLIGLIHSNARRGSRILSWLLIALVVVGVIRFREFYIIIISCLTLYSIIFHALYVRKITKELRHNSFPGHYIKSIIEANMLKYFVIILEGVFAVMFIRLVKEMFF